MGANKIGQLPPELLQKIGQRVVDYFNDVGECLLCDIDADAVLGGPPVHEKHCDLPNDPSAKDPRLAPAVRMTPYR